MSVSHFHIADGWGASIDSPSVEEMREFLDKLDIADLEHCEVWLNHTEFDCTLGCTPNSEVYFQIDDGQNSASIDLTRHLTNVSREKMLMLWQKLASGEMDDLEKEPWMPGYTSEPPPPKPDPKEIHRKFWESLITAERITNAKCKIEECNETPITLTVFCPKHFFEKHTRIPCPFD